MSNLLRNLGFVWKVKEMTSQVVTLQLFFNEAIHVSALADADILKITFRDPYMFVSQKNLAISKRNYLLDQVQRKLAFFNHYPADQGLAYPENEEDFIVLEH